MASIDSRLAALAEAIERKRMEEEAPVDELSRSLYNILLCDFRKGVPAAHPDPGSG